MILASKRWLRLHQAGVNLLEIDLLRRGERPLAHPYLPKSSYLISLWRAGSGQTDAWAIALQDALPVVPLPLSQPAEGAFLDLGQALREAYEQGFYAKSINYGELPPPPAFPRADLTWMKSLGCLGADFA